MILTLSHVTRYSYDRPVRGAVQSLRLTPSRCDGQTARAWMVRVEGGTKGATFRDGGGDWIEGWSIRGPLSEVTVRAEGTVETRDMAGILRGHRESAPPAAYMRATPATEADSALQALAQDRAQGANGGLDSAHRLANAVADVIAYRPGSTGTHTSAAEALAQGQGVCQDQAHALIAMARTLGLPARYVSGYLFSAAGDAPPATAPEAAHAWAEIWVDGLGWIGFDPANRCCPDERYIRLGSGYDAADAAPIRGMAMGGATEEMHVEVAVNSQQQ